MENHAGAHIDSSAGSAELGAHNVNGMGRPSIIVQVHGAEDEN